MNLVEVWFGIIERQAIHRGTFDSVRDLNTKIRAFIDGWNDRAHPFVWTKTADQILAKAKRPKLRTQPTRSCPNRLKRALTIGESNTSMVHCSMAASSGSERHAPTQTPAHELRPPAKMSVGAAGLQPRRPHRPAMSRG